MHFLPVSFWESLEGSLRKSREKIGTKVLLFVPLGQRRGGGILKEGLTPLLDIPHIINSEQEELKGGEVLSYRYPPSLNQLKGRGDRGMGFQIISVAGG